MLGRLVYFPDLFLLTLGLLYRRRGDGNLDSEGLLRRRRGLMLLFLARGLMLCLLAYLRGGERDLLRESEEGLGDIRRRLAGGGLRLPLASLKRRSRSRGGGTDGDRCLRRLGGEERVTEDEACRRGGLGLRDGENRLLVEGKGERERERELLSRDEGRRGDDLYRRIEGEREPLGVIDRERRRGGEREPRRRAFYFH